MSSGLKGGSPVRAPNKTGISIPTAVAAARVLVSSRYPCNFLQAVGSLDYSSSLAQIQLQVTLGHLFAHYEIQLCEPIPERLDWHDHFVATPAANVMIKIRPRQMCY
jgi:hypothetical protein